MHALLFALIGLVGLAAPQDPAPKPQPKPVEWVKEPDTEVKFPSWMRSKQHDKTMELCGVAVRDKRFVILVNVYAYALYIDEPSIQAHFQAFFSQRPKKAENNRLFEALGKDEITRTIKLQFVRDVSAKKVRGAFEDSIEPRLKIAREKKGWTDGDKALTTFRSFFTKEIEDGQTIEFTWLPGHKLVTTVNGTVMQTIESKALTWALWDTYFGDDPIETKGKSTAVKRLLDILQKTPKVDPEQKDKPKEEPK
ncbi:MAG: chalcone isomerase family protein [Planctomycetota bacterium]